jgi:CRP-like cAMP-binding protein
LSLTIMRAGRSPKIRALPPGGVLCQQGDPGNELYLVLDGLLDVYVNDQIVATLGPGAVLGERALLEGGRRTSTLRAQTAVKVACAPGDGVDRAKLEALAQGRRREEG